MQAIREACERLPTLRTIDLVDFASVRPEFRRAAPCGRSSDPGLMDSQPVSRVQLLLRARERLEAAAAGGLTSPFG